LQNCKKKTVISLVISVRLSVCPTFLLSVGPHGATRLPLDGIPSNFVFEYFSKEKKNLLRKFKFY